MFFRFFLKPVAFLLFLGLFNPCLVMTAQQYSYAKLPLFADKENVVVTDVERDAKGFIWFITNGNVYRFNGYTSLNLQNSLPEGVSLDDMPQLLYIDNENRLWISGVNSLSFFDIDTWQLYEIPEEQLPPIKVNEVTWIKQMPNGQVFVAYISGHLLVIDGDSIRLDDTLYQKSKASGMGIQPRSFTIWKDKLWVGTSAGSLYTISLNNTQHTEYIQLPNIEGKLGYLFSQEHQLLVDVLSDGMYAYNTKKLTHISNNDPSENHLMRHGVRENELYIAHIIDGVVKLFDKKTLTVIATMPNVLPAEPADTFDIFISGNEILVATVEGVYIFYPQAFGISSLAPDSENKSVRAFYKYPDGSIFYASYGGYRYIDPKGNPLKVPLYKEVYCVLPIDESRLLLGTEGTFLRIFDRERLVHYDVEYTIESRYEEEFRLSPPIHIKSLAEDETNYYVGSTSGLWAFNKETSILTPLNDLNAKGISQNLFVRDISVEDHTLLLSTHIGLMEYNINNGIWKKIYPQEKIMGIYQHIKVKDTIWLATQSNGVVGIDDEGNVLRTINTAAGLSDNLVYSLAIVNDYKVAGTNNGLNIIKGQRIKKPNTKNGISQAEYNHGATFYAEDSQLLYMGGLNGYTILDMKTPWFQNDNDVTSSTITEISITDSKNAVTKTTYSYPYHPINNITLSPQQDILQIYVSTIINYKNSERLFYKLGEENDFWQEIPQGQPISLTGLSPDSYELFIGTESEIVDSTPIKLVILKEPTFFQTLYFQLLIFVVLTFAVWFWFERKKRKLKEEQNLRTKISSDLHDDVGSLLTGISMQVEYLGISKKEYSNDSQLKKISDSCKEAIRAMGDIVWSIDARNDNWDSLIAKIRQYAYHLFEPSNIEFSFEVTGIPSQKFSQQDRHAIYLIVKEALHNSQKHSGATRVEVLVAFSSVQVQIHIKDNGKGFPEQEITLGQGLKNMKKRAEGIHANFHIYTSRSGTTIRIHKKI